MSAPRCQNLFLIHRQFFAGGNSDLPLNKIDASDQFCYGMFDLKASIHLKKEKLFILVNEFDRARVEVADCLCGFNGGGTHCVFDAIW